MNLHPAPHILQRCEKVVPHVAPPGTPPFVSPEFRPLYCPECKDWTEHRLISDFDQPQKTYECGECRNPIIYMINPFGIDL